ncbi:MAG: PKD-like family lipoprotein, partial [Chlorobiales bacterium]|nr:PKD-like family lipoprotein [Chlorobiales bacterium]
MMKNRYNILFIVLLSVAGLLASCYDDSSTLDVNEIPGLYVNQNGVDKLNVFQYERLQVNPDISIVGIDEQNIEYEWKINSAPDDTLFSIIGTEKNLDYEMLLKPNQGGKTYQLLFTAKDKLHDLEYLTVWDLEVKNPINEGLVVAELHSENKTDFSLIMAPEVTEDYDKVTILKNVYSVNSGQQIDGEVKQIRFTNMYGSNIILAITNNSITQINTFDYSFGAMNDDLFFAAKDSYSPQLLGGVNQSDIYVGNNRLTATWLGISRKFGLPFDFSYEVPDHVA